MDSSLKGHGNETDFLFIYRLGPWLKGTIRKRGVIYCSQIVYLKVGKKGASRQPCRVPAMLTPMRESIFDYEYFLEFEAKIARLMMKTFA
jgi:hypothetical protein